MARSSSPAPRTSSPGNRSRSDGSTRARSSRVSSTATCICRSSAGARTSSRRASPASRTGTSTGKEGGIFRSARMLAEAGDEEVLAFSKALAAEMAEHGTTAMELKTRVRRSRSKASCGSCGSRGGSPRRSPQTCTVTLLACHAVPDGWSREDWVTAACDELVPAAVAEGLADAVDIYVEDIAFSLEDLERVAAAASAAGLAASRARRPARAERGGRGRRRAGRAERRPSEPPERGRRGRARRGADGGGPAPRLDVHPPRGAGARRCAPRRRRRPRDRDRPEPRDLPGLLDARDDRDGLLALRDDAARGADRGDREPRVGARHRRPGRHPRAGEARRPRGAGRARRSPTCRTGRDTTRSSPR